MSVNAPLAGIRVLEFTHAVMGPAAGLMLAQLGAEVIHIEPPQGDSTRRLKGFGTGYFPFYARQKQSLAVDLKSPEGLEVIYRLVRESDVVVENFGPGTMDRLGLGDAHLKSLNPALIYCSLKGFLSGPYEQRTAMDEVVQMMGGLAYMTGPPGQPLRAGTSVIDIGGGMFGVMGILAALFERQKTGQGQTVKSALFETTAFFMGQHMAYSALTEGPIPPMPARVSAWSIYRVFQTQDDPIFIGIISDKQWVRFCEALERSDWATDERLTTNGQRIDEREWLIPAVEEHLARYTQAEIIERVEPLRIPFSPIARPEDLFEDPHLNQSGGLSDVELKPDVVAKLPNLPLEIEGARLGSPDSAPALGADSLKILRRLGYQDADIEELIRQRVVTCS